MAKIKQRVGGHKKASGKYVPPYTRTVERRPPSPYIPNSEGVAVTSGTTVDTKTKALAAAANPSIVLDGMPQKPLNMMSSIEYQDRVRSVEAEARELGDMAFSKSFNPGRAKKDEGELGPFYVDLFGEGHLDFARGGWRHTGLDEQEVDFSTGGLSTLKNIKHPMIKNWYEGGLGNPEVKTNPDSRMAATAVT